MVMLGLPFETAISDCILIWLKGSDKHKLSEKAKAQKSNSNMTGSTSRNQNNMMIGTYGPNVTGSVPLGPTLAICHLFDEVKCQ